MDSTRNQLYPWLSCDLDLCFDLLTNFLFVKLSLIFFTVCKVLHADFDLRWLWSSSCLLKLRHCIFITICMILHVDCHLYIVLPWPVDLLSFFILNVIVQPSAIWHKPFALSVMTCHCKRVYIFNLTGTYMKILNDIK